MAARERRLSRPAAGAWHRWLQPGRPQRDLLLVAGATIAAYAGAAAVELHELASRWLAGYERWQLDELPTALGVLSAGLAWYAFRRRGEAWRAWQARRVAESRAATLLARNRELAQGLIALQENERLALARELHDELGQGCTAIRAETACLRREAGTQVALQAAAQRADAAAASLYQGVRDLLRRLRPANLDELGLLAALQDLCEACEERSGLACVLHHEGVALPGPGAAAAASPEPLPGAAAEGSTGAYRNFDDRVEITVYRIAQEALTNAMRHAQASQVRLRLSCTPGVELRLSIEDDGRGMDPGVARRGLGLLGARERAAALGGTLAVASAPGRGCRLLLTLPLAKPQQRPAEAPAP